jgi:hypothetical protein
MKKLRMALLTSILLASSVATASASTVYDLVSGFSGSTNPNGVWSYAYGTAGSDSLFSSGQSDGTTCGTALCGWYNGGAVPDAIGIAQNTTGSTKTSGTVNIPNNYLTLDPEEYNAEVIFTVPSGGAGNYTISGNFYGDDTGENSHPVDILDNSTNVFSNTISSYQQSDPFSFSETLAVGNTITFYVGTGSTGCSYCNLGTGLQGTITLNTASGVPEPATWLLTCGGVVVIVGRKWRQGRRTAE